MNYTQKVKGLIGALPAISGSTVSIINMIASEDYQINDLIRLIETDITLSSRCLQTVNSAIYGLKSEISSIKRAVVMLGAKTVAEIAVQTSLGKALDHDLSGYHSGRDDLWRHGLCTAIASKQVATQLLDASTAEIAYTAGLLHDIGKIIISELLIEARTTINEKISEDSYSSFLEKEVEMFGIEHAEVGALIAESWNLPDVLVNVIRYHHHPSKAPEADRKLILAVHLGDIFAMMAGAGTQLDNMHYPLDPIAEELIERDDRWQLETFPKLLLNIDTRYQEAVALSGGGRV